MKIKNRKTNEIIELKESKYNTFVYNTLIGRLILKITNLKFISKLGGLYLSSSISKNKINKFIKKNNININEYEEKNYNSFNDFFTRKIKKENRIVDKTNNNLVSPCDGKLMVYKIDKDSIFKIKNSYYKVNDLVEDEVMNKYSGGYALIFRLCVDDYHRYMYFDDGKMTNHKKINGILQTVRPIAQEKYPIFIQNQREVSYLNTKNFGEALEIEVGALMVGKIVNHNISNFKRGDEKGYFEFGGSTIILLINNIDIDEDIINNSNNNIETIVKMGEKVGKKRD